MGGELYLRPIPSIGIHGADWDSFAIITFYLVYTI
jgi:hypothetical protein